MIFHLTEVSGYRNNDQPLVILWHFWGAGISVMCCHLCLSHFQMELTGACLPSVTAYCLFPVAQRTEGLAGWLLWKDGEYCWENLVFTDKCGFLSFEGLQIWRRREGKSIKLCIPRKVFSVEDKYQQSLQNLWWTAGAVPFSLPYYMYVMLNFLVCPGIDLSGAVLCFDFYL